MPTRKLPENAPVGSLDYVLRSALLTVVFSGLNALGQGLIKAAAPRARPAAVVPLTEAEKQGLYLSGGSATHTLLAFDVPLGGKWDFVPGVQTASPARAAFPPNPS